MCTNLSELRQYAAEEKEREKKKQVKHLGYCRVALVATLSCVVARMKNIQGPG